MIAPARAQRKSRRRGGQTTLTQTSGVVADGGHAVRLARVERDAVVLLRGRCARRRSRAAPGPAAAGSPPRRDARAGCPAASDPGCSSQIAISNAPSAGRREELGAQRSALVAPSTLRSPRRTTPARRAFLREQPERSGPERVGDVAQGVERGVEQAPLDLAQHRDADARALGDRGERQARRVAPSPDRAAELPADERARIASIRRFDRSPGHHFSLSTMHATIVLRDRASSSREPREGSAARWSRRSSRAATASSRSTACPPERDDVVEYTLDLADEDAVAGALADAAGRGLQTPARRRDRRRRAAGGEDRRRCRRSCRSRCSGPRSSSTSSRPGSRSALRSRTCGARAGIARSRSRPRRTRSRATGCRRTPPRRRA